MTELSEEFHDWVEVMTAVLDAKNSYTRGHSERVGHITALLGKRLALDEKMQELVHIAGHLHDIGKIAVPDDILGKPGRLTAQEYEEVKRHPAVGADILEKVACLKPVVEMVRHHHERWDGGGYPDGLCGARIPLGARIIAVADSFDAMTSSRPYRGALTLNWALEEIKKGKGSQFDPQIAEVFLKMARSAPELLRDEAEQLATAR